MTTQNLPKPPFMSLLPLRIVLLLLKELVFYFQKIIPFNIHLKDILWYLKDYKATYRLRSERLRVGEEY